MTDPYGFRIVGEHGVTQVDQDYKNLAVCASGSLSPPSDPTTYINVVYTGINPIIAFSCPQTYVVAGPHIISGNTWTFRLRAPAGGSFTIKYWIFDEPPGLGLPTHGLVVRNEAGDITFRSDHRYMRIANWVQQSFNVNTETFALDVGRSYAVVCTGDTLFNPPNGEGPWPMYQIGFKVNGGGTINKSWPIVGSTVIGFIPFVTQFLIVDVTGYPT
jgi:hypothetical protein